MIAEPHPTGQIHSVEERRFSAALGVILIGAFKPSVHGWP